MTVTLLPRMRLFWPSFFFYEYPDFDYVYIQLYSDNNYMNCIDLGLIVDKTKSDGGDTAGREVSHDEPLSERICFAEQERSVAAFAIKTDTNPMIRYGCWYVTNYATNNPLVDGEVEVLSSDAETNAIHLRLRVEQIMPKRLILFRVSSKGRCLKYRSVLRRCFRLEGPDRNRGPFSCRNGEMALCDRLKSEPENGFLLLAATGQYCPVCGSHS